MVLCIYLFVYFDRILDLARHKTSKTIWATTPWWVSSRRSPTFLWTPSSRKQTPAPTAASAHRVQDESNPSRYITLQLGRCFIDLAWFPDSRRVCGLAFPSPHIHARQSNADVWHASKTEVQQKLRRRGFRWLRALRGLFQPAAHCCIRLAKFQSKVFSVSRWKEPISVRSAFVWILLSCFLFLYIYAATLSPKVKGQRGGNRFLLNESSSWTPPVRSWTGATRSRYGRSPQQRSQPFRVPESNTCPGTEEASRRGTNTSGNVKHQLSILMRGFVRAGTPAARGCQRCAASTF